MRTLDSEKRPPWSNSTVNNPEMVDNKQPHRTWHRICWQQRPFHTTEARESPMACYRAALGGTGKQQQAQQQSEQGQRPTVQQSGRGNIVAHTHSCTFMHSQKQMHTHRTTLMKSWVPGRDGPPAALNTEWLCDELNMRLLNIDQTLQGLLAANTQQDQQRQQQQQLSTEAAAVRHKIENIALQQQLAFSTALLLDWCGVAPAGSAEQVLQQLIQ